jgi:hypothetical protein
MDVLLNSDNPTAGRWLFPAACFYLFALTLILLAALVGQSQAQEQPPPTSPLTEL